MNAETLLSQIAAALAKLRLDAVMIGNAAAALHGAPVTTLDVDFVFRPTPTNLRKLKALARELGASVFRPYYPVSGLYRLMNEDRGLQLDFMTAIHGIRSFEGLRARAVAVPFGPDKLLVASLADIIKSKRAAGRERDLAVLEVLEKTLHEQEREKNDGRLPR